MTKRTNTKAPGQMNRRTFLAATSVAPVAASMLGAASPEAAMPTPSVAALGAQVGGFIAKIAKHLPFMAPERDHDYDHATEAMDAVAQRFGHLALSEMWALRLHLEHLGAEGEDGSNPVYRALDWLTLHGDEMFNNAPARTLADAVARLSWLDYFLREFGTPTALPEIMAAVRLDFNRFAENGPHWINPDPRSTFGGWWEGARPAFVEQERQESTRSAGQQEPAVAVETAPLQAAAAEAEVDRQIDAATPADIPGLARLAGEMSARDQRAVFMHAAIVWVFAMRGAS